MRATGIVNSIEDTSLADFRAQIETNLFGVIIVTKATIPIMREQGGGHIIQFSSIGGRVGALGRAPYSTAKWGVEGFSEVLAKEVGPLGIKVTIVEPGGFRTDFAGSSTTIRGGRPEYDSTVGAVARFQRDYNGAQPSPPDGTAMAYDAARSQVVLFGARGKSGTPNDTRVWDGANWTQKSPQTIPPPFSVDSAMAFDAAHGQLVLFGDRETWVWDGVNWAPKSPPISPPQNGSAAMAYDSARSQVVLILSQGCVLSFFDTSCGTRLAGRRNLRRTFRCVSLPPGETFNVAN